MAGLKIRSGWGIFFSGVRWDLELESRYYMNAPCANDRQHERVKRKGVDPL